MNNEHWRTEIKKANNSFKKMKLLSDILTQSDKAYTMLKQAGYAGNLAEIASKIIIKEKKGKEKNERRI